MNRLFKALLGSLTVIAVGGAVAEDLVWPVPIARENRLGPTTTDPSLGYLVPENPVGFGVSLESFSPAKALDTQSEREEIRIVASAIKAVIDNDREAYGELVANKGFIDSGFFDSRSKLLPQLDTNDLPGVSSLWNVCGIRAVEFEGLHWKELIAPTKEGLLLWNDFHVEPFSLLLQYNGLKRYLPLAATAMNTDGYTILDTGYCASTTCANPFKLYFKGWIPGWGRRVLEDGKFITDPEESTFISDPNYKLIRFIRDTWHLYSMIPDTGTMPSSPEYKAFADRLSWSSRSNLEGRWESATGFGPDAHSAKQFGVRHSWIRLLYVIDADPVYAVIWLPAYEPVVDEDYAGKGMSLMRPDGFTQLFGVDLIQKEGDSYFVADFHAVSSSELISILSWAPVQSKMLDFFAEEYKKLHSKTP